MAQSFQNVTLSLTLPISCQICLGKVRQPVICSNNHVFCSTCIEVWLKNASQCPTCRVKITPENPCREIIGATNDSESVESHSVKKRMRKTRGELLLREYEDEIETLLKENEDLRGKNLSLETQLKTALDPSTLSVSSSKAGAVDPGVLEEWANKLRVASDLHKKVKEDVDKMKEANKTLRSQNVDLIQENMRLKAEVESRSPQKFGRYTVAALEVKVHQYERNVAQLKKALERSDKHIEELEAQLLEAQGKGLRPDRDAHLKGTVPGESEASAGAAGCTRIVCMRRSLSEMEETSVCTDPRGKSVGLHGNHGLLTTSEPRRGRRGFADEPLTPQKDETDGAGDQSCHSAFAPATPLGALRCLSLRSPVVQVDRATERRPITYLRRLSFEDCGTSSSTRTLSASGPPLPLRRSTTPPKEVLWGGWQDPRPSELSSTCLSKKTTQLGEEQNERRSSMEDPTGSEADTIRAASEASMDAAYLDKISELDSMISEGETSCNQGNHLSLGPSQALDFDVSQIPELEACADLLEDPDSARDQQLGSPRHEGGGGEAISTEAPGVSVDRGSATGKCDDMGSTADNPAQGAKRKCLSGSSMASPSKLSKFM